MNRCFSWHFRKTIVNVSRRVITDAGLYDSVNLKNTLGARLFYQWISFDLSREFELERDFSASADSTTIVLSLIFLIRLFSYIFWVKNQTRNSVKKKKSSIEYWLKNWMIKCERRTNVLFYLHDPWLDCNVMDSNENRRLSKQSQLRVKLTQLWCLQSKWAETKNKVLFRSNKKFEIGIYRGFFFSESKNTTAIGGHQ